MAVEKRVRVALGDRHPPYAASRFRCPCRSAEAFCPAYLPGFPNLLLRVVEPQLSGPLSLDESAPPHFSIYACQTSWLVAAPNGGRANHFHPSAMS